MSTSFEAWLNAIWTACRFDSVEALDNVLFDDPEAHLCRQFESMVLRPRSQSNAPYAAAYSLE